MVRWQEQAQYAFNAKTLTLVCKEFSKRCAVLNVCCSTVILVLQVVEVM